MSKIRIGWFTFTCCEDSTIIFTELLNKHYKEWFEKFEFVHARILQKDDSREIRQMDYAFVEGAISSNSQEVKLKKIREMSTTLVAIGACAVTGAPSNQRNSFNEMQKKEIKDILDKFKYKERVMKLSEVVKVDIMVPGCPMNEQIFLDLMKKVLNGK
jgi:coenzyme F420-reducing hydrogenase gamma subunit